MTVSDIRSDALVVTAAGATVVELPGLSRTSLEPRVRAFSYTHP